MKTKSTGFVLVSILLVLLVGCTYQPTPVPNTKSTPSSTPTRIITPSPTPTSASTPTPAQKPSPTSTASPPPTSTAILTPSPTSKTQGIKVTRVIDGDTIEVDIAGVNDVRYIGVDTPELTDNRPEYYALALEAKEYNRELVEGKSVRLEKDITDTDIYGRLLRYIYVGDIFVNAELVRCGLAWAEDVYSEIRYRSQFESLQTEAQQARRGIWALPAEIKITYIFYDGKVPRVESGEYVEITNLGGQSQNLAGWKLKDIKGGNYFPFPPYILAPRKSIRVYTNEIHLEYGGFSFNSNSPIWNNTEPDTAALFDNNGREVSRKSY